MKGIKGITGEDSNVHEVPNYKQRRDITGEDFNVHGVLHDKQRRKRKQLRKCAISPVKVPLHGVLNDKQRDITGENSLSMCTEC